MVIQKPQLSRKLISPSGLVPQRRCRTRPVRRPRHSRWSVPVHRANCRDPHRRVMEVSRDAVAWDMGRAASAGSRAAGPRSPAQAKPRPGEAPPRCSGSWETRPSPRKGLPGRMLVQDETRLWDSGPGEPRPPAMQPQVRGPLRPSSPGPWLRWGRLRPLRVAGLSALRIPVTTGGKRPRPGPVFVGLEASGGAFSLASPGCPGHRLREGRGAGQVDSYLRPVLADPGQVLLWDVQCSG